MRLGILDTIGLAATLVLAIPVGFVGVRFLVREQYLLGGFMLGVAVLMVVLQRKATTPEDIPAKLAEKVAGKLVKAPEEESESTEE
jgi:hypothetical protein